MIRLSSGKLKKDCNTLKTKIYDITDIKKNRSLIEDGKRLVRIEEINEVVDRAEKIDFKQKPHKIQGLYDFYYQLPYFVGVRDAQCLVL